MARGSEAIVCINESSSVRSTSRASCVRRRIVDAAPNARAAVVLELPQRCWRTLDAERAGALAVPARQGVPFALDRATDLRIDPLALAERGVRFVKLPAELCSRRGRPSPDIEVADLAAVLRRAGIRLIVERSSGGDRARPHRPRRAARAGLRLRAPPGGPLRGAPARSRYRGDAAVAVAAGRRAAASPVPEPEERRPFRAFLRRAGEPRRDPRPLTPPPGLPAGHLDTRTRPAVALVDGLNTSPTATTSSCATSGACCTTASSPIPARDALTRFRRQGGTVVLISNAPRPAPGRRASSTGSASALRL